MSYIVDSLLSTIYYRQLIYVLVWRELRLRYKRTMLGILWSLAPPIAQVLILVIVVEHFFKRDLPNISAYFMCVVFAWQFFSASILDGCSSILHHGSLVKAFPFPREVLPVVSVLSNLIHFLISMLVLLIYLLALNVHIQPKAFFVPIIIFGQTMLCMGLALMLSCWTVYYHDVKFIADTSLKWLYFAVPIMYFLEDVPTNWLNLYMLNPLAVYIDAYRRLLMYPPPLPEKEPLPVDWVHIGIALVISAAVFLLGLIIFRKHSDKLPEWL
ncbi:MAG: ABC transporter permease [Armatimonadota bacterium]|nr:ABC transporter permease [Armatimonadota bacterium]MCX7776677.1 ABC transporter permease [Armatimonadota bacterium]MDW8025708.1 ABC transporter permease [Armatimonadota bacterium]